MILADEPASRALGASLARVIRPGDVVTLSGALGAGKTSIARGLIHALGHHGEVPSPSFALVQPYEELDPPVWHADLYRIESVGELDELGLDSIRGEGVLLVEWPERAGLEAFSAALQLTIEVGGAGRRLTARVPAAWEGRWPPR